MRGRSPRSTQSPGGSGCRPSFPCRGRGGGRAQEKHPQTGGFSWRDDPFAEYRDLGPGCGPARADRPQLTDAQAADRPGGRTPAG
ncbi:hypothetical protein CP979_30920 [Streptomyces filamentosus]|nr:hypothetical protein CP979_30920 [Streptomyces filamentosus]